MSKLSQGIKKIGVSIVSAIRRFPVAVGLATVMMVLAMVLIHNDTALTDAAQKWITRILLTLGLAIPLSVSLQLLLERLERHSALFNMALWSILAVLLLVYLLLLLPDTSKLLYALRYMAFLVAAAALVPAVPYLYRRQGDERFALKLLLRLFITTLFTGILIGGIDLVLLMLEKLLAVKLWDKAYLDTAILAAGLFTPSFFLAGIPRSGTDLEEEPFHPLVRILMGYITYPLLAVYTAIIYAYFVRILIVGSWPSNMLVRMVLWYTIIGVLAIYFMRMQNTVNRWFRLFDTWYPRLTVLPIVLMFIGLFIRIRANGMTEPRYFVLVAAIWVTAITALAIVYKPEKRLNVYAPALVTALAALSVIGPWSAFNASAASQNARLENLLRGNGMLSAQGSIVSKKDIPDADKQKIYDILDYFERVQGLDRVHALPGGTNIAMVPAVLGFDRTAVPGGPNTSYYISSGLPEGTFDIKGYDYIYIASYNKGQQSTPANGLEMKTDTQYIFTIAKDGKVLYTKDMKEYAKSFEGSYVQGKTYSIDELTRKDENASVKVKFIINEADINTVDGITTYSVPNFYAFVKLK